MTAEERARAEAVFVRVMQVMTSNRGVETISDALADARRGALEEAANHGFLAVVEDFTDADEFTAADRRVEAVARRVHARIRALADLPPATATATKKEGG